VIVLIGNALIVLTTILAWTFCILYHAMAPWWRSQMGRNVMTYGLVVAAVLSLSVVRVAFDAVVETPWFSILRLVLFAGVPVAIGWRIAILLRVQRQNGKDRR
jgi:hypothetical protein